MNPQLANFILARTPRHLKNPHTIPHLAPHQQETSPIQQQDSPDTATMAETFTLNSGNKIPAVGLGTWQSDPGQVATAVEHALKAGYRHIDAAFVYGNENEVGDGIKKAIASGVCKREDIFVTSKLW